MVQTLKQLNKSFQRKHVFNILNFIIIVFALSIIQDFLHSQRNDYPFYISESLLFNTFWCLFIPITFFLQKLYHKLFVHLEKTSPVMQVIGIVIIGTITHMILYSISLQIASALFFSHDYLFFNNLSYTVANDFLKYPLGYGLISMLLLTQSGIIFGKEETQTLEESGQTLNKILIRKGRESLAISTKDIISISTSSPYIVIHTSDKKYLHTETLKSLMEKLDQSKFVRIHKSGIIRIDKLQSYTSRLNGDYDVIMENGEEFRLSRNYFKAFRKKITEVQQQHFS